MSLNLIEIKSCTGEIKSEGKTGKISGYGSVFGGNDSYGDTIEKGAFSQALARLSEEKDMPQMLWQHHQNHVIGRWQSVREDEKGLVVDGEIFREVTHGEDAYILLKRNAIKGLSIGFSVGEYKKKKDGGRLIKSISRLHEISIVTFPADSGAQAEVKKTSNDYYSRESFAYLMRHKLGLSSKDAQYIAEYGYEKFLEMRSFDRGAFFGDVVMEIEAIKSDLIN